MRTFDEIQADIKASTAIFDASALRLLTQEMLELGTPRADASASNTLGILSRHDGDYAAALEHYHRAIVKYEELGERVNVAVATGNIGVVYFRIGDYPSALEHYHRALAEHQELGDRYNVAIFTCNLGSVYASIADYPAAMEHYLRALATYEELGDRDGLAFVIGCLGVLYSDTGDHVSAMEHYSRSIAIKEELGDRHGVAIDIGNIGVAYSVVGDYVAALVHYQKALALYEELGDSSSIMNATGNIIDALLELDRDVEASAMLEVQATKSMDNPAMRARHFANKATLAERGKDLDAASKHMQQALNTVSEAGNRSDTATYHQRLRDLAQKRNDFAGYIEHNDAHHRIIQEIQGKNATQKIAVMEADRKMEAERRERDKERALLYGALPESVATRMLRGEKVSGDHYENASVLFLDIVGFTTISDKIPPGHVVHLLSQFFSTIDAVCKKHNVTKIKTIGDSYMAVSGVPDATEDHAYRAACCGLDMLAALDDLEITMPPDMGDTSWTKDVGEIHVRIGIHCGPVTAGVIGTERLQYDVWGDTVNVASRMESTSEPNRIHVSEQFKGALEDVNQRYEGTIELRGLVEIKGKGPLTTYWLT